MRLPYVKVNSGSIKHVPHRREERKVEPLALTVEQAATALGISTRHAYELVRRGELPGIRLGGRWVIIRSSLEEMLQDRLRAAPVEILPTA